jgi:hypothetical protein
MLSYSVFNMAPNAIEQTQLSFKWSEISIQRLEIAFKSRNITRDSTKIEKALFYADTAVAEWMMLNADIRNKTWKEFKLLFMIQALDYRELAVHMTIPKKKYEKMETFLSRTYRRYLEYGLTENEFEKMLRMKVNTIEDLNKVERVNSQRSFFKKKFVIDIIIDEERSAEFFKKKERNHKNAHLRISNSNIKKNNQTPINILYTDKKKIGMSKISIQGEEISSIKDTGADKNIISKDLIKKKGLKTREIQEQTVENIFGHQYKTNEVVNITTKIDGKKTNEEFLVMDTKDKKTVLIGNETIKKLDKIESEKSHLLTKYPKLFDEQPGEGVDLIECEIETVPNKKVRVRQRNIAHSLLEGTKKSIDHYLKIGYIEPSKSSWYNPIRPVPKPDGSVRITSNMQFLNNLVEDDKYSIPNIQKIIEQSQGKKWFTVIDLKDGYFQIRLKKEHRFKSAFYFENKLYQWTRMPQGYKNAPPIFQRLMDQILAPYLGKICSVYLDDILVYGYTEEEHDRNFSLVLNELEKNKMKINLSKIQYKQNEITLLGAIINGVTQRPIHDKKSKIIEFQTPKNAKDVQKFIGFVNYYRKYIKDVGSIAAPLYKLTGTKSEFKWGKEEETSFNKLKEALNQDVAVHIADFTKEFVLTTDASNTGLGAILQQLHEGDLKVIDWASRKLTDAEKNYGITEKEFLAVAWGIEHFDYYLRGRSFKIITDHSALKYIKTKEAFGSIRLERMRERLQEYTFTVEYKKGSEMTNADTLSRLYEGEKEAQSKRVNLSKEEIMERLKPKLKKENGKYYWETKDNKIKEVPEPNERDLILKNIHTEETAHGGRDAVYYKAIQKYYWPGLKEDAQESVNACLACTKNRQKTDGGEIFIETSEKLEIVGIDILTITHGQYLVVAVDYFTRYIICKYSTTKDTMAITNLMNNIIDEIGIPKKIVTDSGTEFNSKVFKAMCLEKKIEHHMTSPGKHQSNGRVERSNRKIWQIIRKEKEEGQRCQSRKHTKIS